MPALTFLNVPSFCSRLDFSTTPVRVDLSGFTFIEPAALVYLGTLLRRSRSTSSLNFSFKPPLGLAGKYMERENFWERFGFRNPPERRLFGAFTSLGEIVDIERRPGIDDEIEADVVRVLERNEVPVDITAVRTIVGELVGNFAEHSQGPDAAFAMQLFPKLKTFEIAVGDCGVGIRHSLARNPKHAGILDQTDAQAALLAIRAGVGGRPSGEGGWGLHYIHQEVRRLGGSMQIYTGAGGLIAADKTVKHGALPFHLSGVQIRVRVGYPG